MLDLPVTSCRIIHDLFYGAGLVSLVILWSGLGMHQFSCASSRSESDQMQGRSFSVSAIIDNRDILFFGLFTWTHTWFIFRYVSDANSSSIQYVWDGQEQKVKCVANINTFIPVCVDSCGVCPARKGRLTTGQTILGNIERMHIHIESVNFVDLYNTGKFVKYHYQSMQRLRCDTRSIQHGFSLKVHCWLVSLHSLSRRRTQRGKLMPRRLILRQRWMPT